MWTNLVLAITGFGALLLIGLPSLRVISQWPIRDGDRPEHDAGWHDQYVYFFGDRELEHRLFEILFLPTHLGEEPDQQELTRRIEELGTEVLPVLFGVLTGEIALRLEVPPEGLELDPATPLRSLPNRDVLLIGALWNFPHDQVLDYIDRAVTPESSIGHRLISARVLSGLRDARTLDVLLRILHETDAVQFERPHVISYFEDALSRVLEEREEGVSELRRDLALVDRTVLPIIVNSVPFQGSSEGPKLIFDLLDRDAELDALVLDRISELAGTLHDEALDDTLWQV